MKNKKNVIMIVMLVAIALMSMGYALFATQLNINSIGNITSQWNVYFESISNGTKVGNASNASTPSVSGTSANMNVNLDLPGDSMTYSLVLKNGGTVGAIIEDIDAKAEGSTGIIYTISGLKIGDKLAAGASKTITVKIEYDPNTSSQPSETYKKLTVTIDAVQDIGQTITSQVPEIEGELGSFARAILNNNKIQSDEDIDFSKGSTYLGDYKEVHSESTVSISMSSSSTYYYGSGYTFDKSTGKYTLTGTTTGKWSTMSSNYKNYPYTCRSTFNGSCSTLYKITEYTNTLYGVGYTYTSEGTYFENGKGLYYNNDDHGVTYYFRGNVDNNYVQMGSVYEEGYSGVCVWGDCEFASYDSIESCVAEVENGAPWTPDDCIPIEKESRYVNTYWRIVRVNGDGTIRMIYAGKYIPESNEVIEPSVGTSEYSIDWGTEYVQYVYDGNKSSTIKEFLDSWYTNKLETEYGKYIADTVFCNETDASSNDRLKGKYSPKFTCSNVTDKYTISSSYGNGLLSKPVGLLTVDEAVFAGAGVNNVIYSPYYYLYSENYWWTMTSSLYSFDNYGSIWLISGNDLVNHNYSMVTGYSNDVRPVINLKSDVSVTGSGTIDDPYVIKTN